MLVRSMWALSGTTSRTVLTRCDLPPELSPLTTADIGSLVICDSTVRYSSNPVCPLANQPPPLHGLADAVQQRRVGQHGPGHCFDLLEPLAAALFGFGGVALGLLLLVP